MFPRPEVLGKCCNGRNRWVWDSPPWWFHFGTLRRVQGVMAIVSLPPPTLFHPLPYHEVPAFSVSLGPCQSSPGLSVSPPYLPILSCPPPPATLLWVCPFQLALPISSLQSCQDWDLCHICLCQPQPGLLCQWRCVKQCCLWVLVCLKWGTWTTLPILFIFTGPLGIFSLIFTITFFPGDSHISPKCLSMLL